MQPVLIISAAFTAIACIFCARADMIYAASLLAVFALPAQLLAAWSWQKIDLFAKISALGTILIIALFAVIMEFIGIHFDFWTFLEDQDRLLGVSIGDIPVEEFLFYYFALAEAVFLYVGLKLLFESRGVESGMIAHKYFSPINATTGKMVARAGALLAAAGALIGAGWLKNRAKGARRIDARLERDHRGRPEYISGRWGPAWFAAIAPWFIIGLLSLRATLKNIHEFAFAAVFCINMPVYLLWEYNALIRGHWVYNENRLLGIKIGVTPVEELFLYVTAIMLSIATFEILREFVQRAHAQQNTSQRANHA